MPCPVVSRCFQSLDVDVSAGMNEAQMLVRVLNLLEEDRAHRQIDQLERDKAKSTWPADDLSEQRSARCLGVPSTASGPTVCSLCMPRPAESASDVRSVASTDSASQAVLERALAVQVGASVLERALALVNKLHELELERQPSAGLALQAGFELDGTRCGIEQSSRRVPHPNERPGQLRSCDSNGMEDEAAQETACPNASGIARVNVEALHSPVTTRSLVSSPNVELKAKYMEWLIQLQQNKSTAGSMRT